MQQEAGLAMGLTGAAVSLAAGTALGGLYFTGLWWTVRRLPGAAHPALLTVASLILRLGLVVGGLVLLADGHWLRAAAALAGILLARTLLVRWLGPPQTARGAA